MNNLIRHIKTHCARMDHGGCALIVCVENNRIVRIKGDPEGFLNHGYVCPKGLASADKLNHPERLRHPLRRIGKRGQGKWARISWDGALDTIAENLVAAKEKFGAKSVAFCQGMPKGLEHFVLIRLANIFGSPNVVAVQDVCHAPREVSGIHTCGFYPVPDFHHKSKLVMAWGSNLTATNEEGTINSLLLDQMKQGTELIVIDPRKTALAERASLWLRIRPGTDHALALAFLNVIIEEARYDKVFVTDHTFGFEELAAHVRQYPPDKMAGITGIPADLIRDGARLYANSHPAAMLWGNAIEQTIHAFDNARALICLMAICGNLDVSGGNIEAVEPPVLGLGKFVRADLIPNKVKDMIHAHHRTIPKMMTVPSAFFKKAVIEEIPYPVKAAYMQCCNPLMSYADSGKTLEALLKLDFFAISDIVMTPTAMFADIVLPAATHFEFDDIGHYGLGHGYVLARPKVVEPPEECWADMKILCELGKRLTDKSLWHDDYGKFAEDVIAPSGLSYGEFAEIRYLKGEDRFRKYEESGFSTPTRKVELKLSRAEKFGLPPLPRCDGLPEMEDSDFPLILTTCKDASYLHSSYRWIEKLRKHSPKPLAQIHPDTAKAYDIREGDEVSIETRTGSITQIAHLSEKILPGVVYAAYGWWFPEIAGFEWQVSNYNMLTSSERVGKEFGTPNLKGMGCRVRKKFSDRSLSLSE